MTKESHTPGNTHKDCALCLQLLPLSSFGRLKASSDGYAHYCKSCKRKQDRQYKARTGRTIKAARRIKEKGYEHLLENTDILPGVLEALHLFYGACGRCGATSKLQTDHVIPIEKRGTHMIDNIGFLCAKCNNWKRDRIMKDYRSIIWLDVILYSSSDK